VKTDLLQKWASLRAKGLSKEAGFLRDTWTYGKEIAYANRYPIAGAAIGGALGAAEGLILTRRRNGQPSFVERSANKMADQVEFEEMVRARRGETPDIGDKLKKVFANSYKGMAKIWSDHPAGAGALLGMTGARVGADVARLLDIARKAE
jgi:hypothetical protein